MLGAIRLAKKRISAHFPAIISIFEWFIISVFIAVCVGSAIALFLVSLEKVTDFRVENSDIIYLLPLAGLLIGYVFKRWGKEVNPGNNLIIENIHNPKRVIPFRMAPFILLGTVVTHLFGGSAGREGTAIQIGGAISDQFTKLLKLNKEKRKMILISGMSAGFGAVFGTPIAGAIFGLEVYHIGKLRYNAIFPAFTSAIIADYVTRWFGIHHTHYQLGNVPAVDVELILFTILAGIAFGFASLLFSKATEKISHLGKKFVKQSYYRPVIGGVVVLAITALLGTHKYLGLGIPTIVEAFTVQQSPEVFFLKIIFTAITLGCGFKGGEVTPLFFI
ncbi:MAG: chloride channel protein, partial [Rhodothermaceae bacterium]